MDHARALAVHREGKPATWDWLFMLLLVASVAGSAWVGVLAYREGLKTEGTKRTGEAWAQWLAEQADARSGEVYAHAVCAAQPSALWGGCMAWLMGPDGPMHGMRSAFTDEPLRVVARCDSADRTGAGMVALEKLTPLPPGSAIPFVVSPLSARDSIEQRLVIRVTVCDKDGGGIRIAEPEF